MIYETRDHLPAISQELKAEILSAPRTSAQHRAALKKAQALNVVQLGGKATQTKLPSQLSIASWNVERCLFPIETAAHMANLSPDIVLLSEIDFGMARTGQRHGTKIIAEQLGMAYAYGVEFFEMGLGGPTELPFCTDNFNQYGWHGNAILSKVPFAKIAMLRLDDHGHWFSADTGAADPEQPRLGGRMALLAVLPTVRGDICVVSTHLESSANPAYRAEQFKSLLEHIEQFAPDMPVMIGGDLNTGNHVAPSYDWRVESLFELAEKKGYSWEFTPEGYTTRKSLITTHPQTTMKLDWHAGRGFHHLDSKIVSSIYQNDKPLSDHDCIWCKIEIA